MPGRWEKITYAAVGGAIVYFLWRRCPKEKPVSNLSRRNDFPLKKVSTDKFIW